MSLDPSTAKLAEELIQFMQDAYGFDRVPSISYVDDEDNGANPLCMTGGYDQEGETITIYITGRHPKDILRSLAHEMLHHVQKCEGMMDGRDMSATADPNYIMHDDFLKGVEADAFGRGNITFREWEATKKGDKKMNEEKIPKKKLSSYKKAVSKAGEMVKGEYPEDIKWKVASTIAKKKVGVDEVSYEKSGLEEPEKADLDDPKDKDISPYELKRGQAVEKSMGKNKLKESVVEDKKEEVQVNDALKNSHNYNTVTRALPNVAKARDEFVYEELLKKFKIKK
jgi:hypothetical protein